MLAELFQSFQHDAATFHLLQDGGQRNPRLTAHAAAQISAINAKLRQRGDAQQRNAVAR